MEWIRADDDLLTWAGAIEVEHTAQWSRAWRLPLRTIALFPGEVLRRRATGQAGVRVRFSTDASLISGESISIPDEPTPMPDGETGVVDLVIEDRLVASAPVAADGTFEFDGVPVGVKVVELWLPQFVDFRLARVGVSPAARIWRAPESRQPRLITYGSSITQCRSAASPAKTWPSLVACELGMDLTCLGYGGQCHLDPMIARMIRDLPADLIVTCLGINVYTTGTFNARSFLPALLGFLSAIRDGHPGTPILVISPIHSVGREDVAAEAGMTLAEIRGQVAEAVHLLDDAGDKDIHLLNGLDVIGVEQAGFLADGSHPDTAGYAHMASVIAPELRRLAGM